MHTKCAEVGKAQSGETLEVFSDRQGRETENSHITGVVQCLMQGWYSADTHWQGCVAI